jgi:hypothetical protein
MATELWFRLRGHFLWYMMLDGVSFGGPDLLDDYVKRKTYNNFQINCLHVFLDRYVINSDTMMALLIRSVVSDIPI